MRVFFFIRKCVICEIYYRLRLLTDAAITEVS